MCTAAFCYHICNRPLNARGLDHTVLKYLKSSGGLGIKKMGPLGL